MAESEEKIKSHRLIMMNMIWSFISLFISYLMNFLITPYVTENIGVEAYGFVSLANTFVSYIDLIAVSLNAFAGRFIAIEYHRGNKAKAGRYFSSTLLADAVMAAVILAAGSITVYKLDSLLHIPAYLDRDVKLLFAIVLFRYALTVLRTAYDAAAFIAERIDIAERMQSRAYIIQGVLLLVLCLCFKPHVWYVGLAAAGAALFLLIADYGVCRKLTPDLKFERSGCSVGAVSEIISAGIWTSVNNLGNVLNSGLDLIIVNLMLDASVMGMISVDKSLEVLAGALIMKVSASFKPSCLKLYAGHKTDELAVLLKNAMKFTSSLCNLIAAGFIACGYDFLKLWLPGQNTDFLFKISVIVLMSVIPTGMVHPLYYVYTLTRKLKLPCFITVAMGVCNVISMIILLKFTSLGAYAVVLTTLVINCVHFIDAPLYAAHCLKLPYGSFYPAILKNAAVLAAGIITAVYLKGVLPHADTWIGFAAKGAAAGAILAALFGAAVFLPDLLLKKAKKV